MAHAHRPDNPFTFTPGQSQNPAFEPLELSEGQLPGDRSPRVKRAFFMVIVPVVESEQKSPTKTNPSYGLKSLKFKVKVPKQPHIGSTGQYHFEDSEAISSME